MEIDYSDWTPKEVANKFYAANVFDEHVQKHWEIKQVSQRHEKAAVTKASWKTEGFYVKQKSYSDFVGLIGVKKKTNA